MTHQGHAKFSLASSMCEGHKEHDICARDGGLVSHSLPPATAVTERTLLLSDVVETNICRNLSSLFCALLLT